jgi:hypothetical protein
MVSTKSAVGLPVHTSTYVRQRFESVFVKQNKNLYVSDTSKG